jgi:branched-chain amino acid transport system ATP-binding protein
MLEVNAINVAYGDLQVLHEVSFSVQRGEVVALVGGNGAGKTTSIKAVSGLLHPTGGSIQFLGQRIERLPAHRVVELGVVQVPEGRKIFPSLSVLENLELGSFTRKAKRRRAEGLEYVYGLFPVLKERAKQAAGTLSGGEQQMLAIGRALMAQPQLLMLDEPSLGLAPIIVREIFQIVQTTKSRGTTILLVEQNVQHTLRLADRAYVLENGRIVLTGTGQELLNSEHTKRAYLGE